MNLILDLIFTFMKIDLLAFGGGYAALPLIQEQVVNVKGWMTFAEFSDIMAIDELTPGPIIINAATFVGTKLAGIPGAVAATLGSILPSCVIALVLVKVYQALKDSPVFQGALSGLRCMVAGLISASALTMLLASLFGEQAFRLASLDLVAALIAAAAFVIMRTLKPDPLIVVLGCGALGLAAYSFF